MKDARISTGIRGLDEVLEGGFMPSSSYLIVGGPGTGKTILSLQFMHESAKRKASCLYITFAEPEEALRRNVAGFGWDLAGIVFVDFTKQADSRDLPEEYTVFPAAEVEKEPVWQRLYQAIDEHKPERLVLDSATYLRYLSTDDYQFRKHIQRLVNYLSERKCLSLLLFEPTELERENALALAVDGVITLRNETSRGRVVEIRTIEINKMRGSSFISGRHPLRITADGITVWPHKIEKLKKYAYERTMLSSGTAELDELLMGGIPAGTCTLISGPAGIGKSTLSARYLSVAAAKGIKGVIYTFEEGLASILERCRSMGMDLDALVEKGSLIVREINPLDHYPDELLDTLRTDILKNKAQIVMLDSLRGYNLAMEEFGSLLANIQNIINFVRHEKASIFLINEQEKITGDLQITEHGVSYMADNILLIRYAERRGEVIRVISCFKKRLGGFHPDIREFSITQKGIVVGEKLTHWSV